MATPTEPATQHEWTIHALNIHGAFLERRCVRVIEETPGWQVVSTNFPVEFPRSNSMRLGNESSLDIWARLISKEQDCYELFIECKKANPDFVNWVFFSKQSTDEHSPLHCLYVEQVTGTDSSPPAYQWSHVAVSSRNPEYKLFLASDAREVRENFGDPKLKKEVKTKTSNAAVYDASSQVSLASQCIAALDMECLKRAESARQTDTLGWKRKFYVPIIVTTANLFSLEFDVGSIDLSIGEIPWNKAELKEVESVIYEYPLPRRLQAGPSNPLAMLDIAHYEAFSRMHIPVVQAKFFSKFLTDFFPD